MDGQGEVNRAKRESVFRAALVTLTDNGRTIECRVRNMSVTGLGISHRGELSAGMAVSVVVGRAPAMDGRVIWASTGQAGIAVGTAINEDHPQFEHGKPVVKAGWLAEIDHAYRLKPM